MTNIVIETIAQIVSMLFYTLIGIFGAWLTVKINKSKDLQNVDFAKNTVIAAAQQTVLELNQMFVNDWKKANEDGKLTSEEVDALKGMLVDKTLEKLSNPVCELIEAAGVDITNLIQGAGEAYIASLKY